MGIRITAVSLTSDSEIAAAVHQLQRKAYRAEAELIGDERIPPLHESLDQMVEQPLDWLGAFNKGGVSEDLGLVGAVAFAVEGQSMVINRLMVGSAARRRGIGSDLVGAVISEARGLPIAVSTGRDNTPACALYLRMGFRPAGFREVVSGLWVADFVF